MAGAPYQQITEVALCRLAGQCLAEYGMAKGEAATSLCLLEVQCRVEVQHDAAMQSSR